MSERILDEDLELGVFTSELIDEKFNELDQLQKDYETVSKIENPSIRQIAEEAHRAQVNAVYSSIGELALGLPSPSTVGNEIKLLIEPSEAAKTTARSVVEFGHELAEIMPFAKTKVLGRAFAIEQHLGNTPPDISEDTKRRLESLQRVERVLSKIAASSIMTEILAHLSNEAKPDGDKENQIEQVHAILSEKDLVRQLFAPEPRARLYEFCEAFQGYPVELTTLGKAVYLHESKDSQKKRNQITNTVNPKQKAGKLTHRDLAEKGLVLQFGWYSETPTGTDRPRRILRCLPAKDYDNSKDSGTAFIGATFYRWEDVDPQLVESAKEK